MEKILKFNRISKNAKLKDACDYMYRVIEAYNIQIKIMKMLRKSGGVLLLDIKTVCEITKWSEHEVRKLFEETELKTVETSNKLQIEAMALLSYLSTVLNPFNTKYWKLLKNDNISDIEAADTINLFNAAMDVLEQYNREAISLTKFYIENETQLQDVATVAKNEKWSERLTRKVFSDPDLKTVEISNRLQVHPSVLSKYLQKGLYPDCNRYWAKTA